jgi:replicative DNA helicase
MTDLDFSNDLIEKLLLKKTLTDKKWLSILSGVYDKRWFKTPNLSLVLKIIINYYSKYNSIPNNKVINALCKKYKEKTQANDVNLSEINELLADTMNLNLNISDDIINANIKGFIRKNAFLQSLFDNAELLEKSPDSYENVVDKCLENFDRVQKITFNDADLGLNYFDPKAMEAHWEYIRNPEAKIKTGWQAIDSLTNGGFLKDGKMLALFMAQAGLGKSVFLSNLAVNALKQNLSVVVISLEMSQDVYASRFDAHISNHNINRLRDNETSAVERIKDFYKQYPNANLYIKEYPPRSIRPSDIEAYLENLRAAGKNIDLIIIDYLNLVLAQQGSDNMFKDGLAVSEKLRALSYTFNAPVVSAVQANTSGMNTEDIGMENISESRGIAHTADFIAALYQLDEDREAGKINVRILKNRLGGKVGQSAQFKLNPESLVVEDITFNNDDYASNPNSEVGTIVNGLQNISDEINDW